MLNKKTKDRDEKYWRKKYIEILPIHEQFCKKLEGLIKEMLHKKEIEYVLVKPRVKLEDSFMTMMIQMNMTNMGLKILALPTSMESI